MDWQKIFFWLKDKASPPLDEKRLENMVDALLRRGRKIHLTGQVTPYQILSVCLLRFFKCDYRLVVFFQPTAYYKDQEERMKEVMGQYVHKFLFDYFNETNLGVSALEEDFKLESYTMWFHNKDIEILKEWDASRGKLYDLVSP